MAKTVDYYFSTSSPWTYLGSKRFTEMAAKAGATVNVWPVNFGRIFPVSGGLPLPKRAPQRQAYRMMELARWKRRLGVPLVLEPKHFPSTAPLSPKLIIAARNHGHDALGLSNAILAALWAEDRSIDDPAVLEQVANGCGLDGKALLAEAGTDALAKQYDDDSDAAIAKNVFGAPSFVIDGEIFWGQDRLDFVAEKLGV
jgi:2-hydroxychromene-2-carboxylate isomerase